MAAKLLLPGNWDIITPNTSENQITSNLFNGRLYNESRIVHSGVPSIYARAFAFKKALESPGSHVGALRQFKRLVQGIFLGIITIEEYALDPAVANIKLTNTLLEFNSAITRFHVLKWQGLAIGGIYPDTFVFPGAKFLEASEWRDNPDGISPELEYIRLSNGAFVQDITLQALEGEIQRRMDLYGHDMIKALFEKWYSAISLALALPAGVSTVWLDRLAEIRNDEWQTTIVAPNNGLKNFTDSCSVSLNNNDGVLVAVDIRSFNKDKNIFCNKIIKIKGGRYPDFPVKAEHNSLIDFNQTRLNGTINQIPTYDITLNGWSASFQWRPLNENIINNGYEASLLLWPNFKATNWRVNYIYFTTDNNLPGVNAFAKLYDSTFGLQKEIGCNKGTKTDNPVEYIEINVNGNPHGIFRDSREPVLAGAANRTITLDFGTCNTTIGDFDNDRNPQVFIFNGLTCDILGSDFWLSDNYSVARNESYFLPTAASNVPLSSVPSEIAFVTKADMDAGDASLDSPIEKFTIPHPNYYRAGDIPIVTNFKWDADTQFTTNRVLIKAYLKMILHLTLAQIRRDSRCTQVFLIPTFPLAFEDLKYADYKQLFIDPATGLFSEIFLETGVNLGLASLNAAIPTNELVSESSAVKTFSAHAPKKGRPELVVDVGGGTTDIVMWFKGQGGQEYELIESIKYGGNVYLKYFANKFPDKGSVIALQKKVREQGIQGLMNTFKQKGNSAVASHAIGRFFAGIFAYINRLLAKYNSKEVNFYPVGNGWKLIEGCNFTIPVYIRDVLRQWDIEATVVTPFGDDYKGAVCKGALRIAQNMNYIHPNPIEVKTILGGTIEVNGKELKWDHIVPTGGIVPQITNIHTKRFLDEIINIANIQISNNEKQQFIGKFNNAFAGARYTAPGNQNGLKKSAMSVFLEKVYPDML